VAQTAVPINGNEPNFFFFWQNIYGKENFRMLNSKSMNGKSPLEKY
jgi:hypothetical protein